MRFNGLAVLAQAAKGVEVVPRCSGTVFTPWPSYALAQATPGRPAGCRWSKCEVTDRLRTPGGPRPGTPPRPHVQALTAHQLRLIDATSVAKRGWRGGERRGVVLRVYGTRCLKYEGF